VYLQAFQERDSSVAAKGNNSDSFRTFLETLRAPDSRQRATAPPATQSLVAIKVLALLVIGVRPLTQLQAQSGLNFVEFGDALRRLQGQGFVVIEGQPGAEQARLTLSGEQFWRSMR
jgi:hypothetical protein